MANVRDHADDRGPSAPWRPTLQAAADCVPTGEVPPGERFAHGHCRRYWRRLRRDIGRGQESPGHQPDFHGLEIGACRFTRVRFLISLSFALQGYLGQGMNGKPSGCNAAFWKM